MEVWIPGGVFCNFGFGLRLSNFGKSWKFGFRGGYSATSDLDLGKKLEVWISGGVFCNFGFGLREKVGSLDFQGGYSATSDLDLGKKLEVWIPGGVFCNFGFGLREKVGSLDSGGGILQLRIFGLRFGKSWKFGFRGGYSATSDLDLGKKLEVWILGGVFCNFGFGLREKVGSLDSGGGILQLRIWT